MSVAVELCDVGPRDGLQNELAILAPRTRAELCLRLAGCGLRRVEAASFVRDDRVPAMAGAAEVFAALADAPGVRWAALVLNERGYERALDAGAREVHYAFPVTETFAARNQGTSVEQALAVGQQLCERARADQVTIAVTLSAAFGCPYEGEVATARVAALAAAVAASGPHELMLADSIGVGRRGQVRELFTAIAPEGVRMGAHFHDTHGTGYDNALAAVQTGVTLLDASVGGTGGCPFAPGAPGNVATERLVERLEADGHETGVDLVALRACAAWLRGELAAAA